MMVVVVGGGGGKLAVIGPTIRLIGALESLLWEEDRSGVLKA